MHAGVLSDIKAGRRPVRVRRSIRIRQRHHPRNEGSRAIGGHLIGEGVKVLQTGRLPRTAGRVPVV